MEVRAAKVTGKLILNLLKKLMKEAEKLEIGSEIAQGQMEQTITVKIGDNLDALMGSEILLEDGKVVAFRQ